MYLCRYIPAVGGQIDSRLVQIGGDTLSEDTGNLFRVCYCYHAWLLSSLTT